MSPKNQLKASASGLSPGVKLEESNAAQCKETPEELTSPVYTTMHGIIERPSYY